MHNRSCKLIIWIMVIMVAIGTVYSTDTVYAANKNTKAMSAKISSTGYTSVKFSWKKVRGVTGYEIYRASSKKGKYKKVAKINEITILNYTDRKLKQGKYYYYKFRTYKTKANKTNTYGKFSKPLSVQTYHKKWPIISGITATSTYVTLSWKKPEGNVKKYYVQRKTEKGKWKTIAAVKSTKTSYTDKKIKVGKKYYYRIINKARFLKYTGKLRTVVPARLSAPKLISLSRYPGKTQEYAELKWKTAKNTKYYIYRKTSKTSWHKLAAVRSGSSSYTYLDKTIDTATDYIYTVRRVKETGNTLEILSKYDANGITTIKAKPKVSVDFTNLDARIAWTKVNNADGYLIYRKNGYNDSWAKIATIKGNNSSYTDVYYNTMKLQKDKALFTSNRFIDPSNNPLIYMVRAYKNNGGKYMYGNYYIDGEFFLEAPSIVSVKKNGDTVTIEWGTVPNTEYYYLYKGKKDGERINWSRVDTVKHSGKTRQQATITAGDDTPYYTVQAAAMKNGTEVLSKFDEGFTIEHQGEYTGKKILYIGDSITYGSPYKTTDTFDVFTYPWRIKQLTGVEYFNPSIPAATYRIKPDDNKRKRLVRDVAEKIHNGEAPVVASHTKTKPCNYEDFDVVIMAAGTNDYLDDAVLGSIEDPTDMEFDLTTFYGAVNQIMTWIKEGSDKRAAEGKDPIKVVFVDLFYGDRTYNYKERTDRFITKNHLGLTLKNYQNALDDIALKYQKNGLDIWTFDTGELVTQKNCPYATSDNLHMSRFTYTQIGNELAEFLMAKDIL